MKSEDDRKLTEREKKRKKAAEETISAYESRGYHSTEMTVGVVKANFMSVIVCLPFISFFILCWIIVNGKAGVTDLRLGNMLFLSLSILVSIVIHELIHGLFWGMAAPSSYKSIEFGFIKEMLTPYCACKEPVSKKWYLIGAAAPGVILGFLPCIVSIMIKSPEMLFYGILMIFGAGADLMIVLRLIAYRTGSKELLCLDHPTKVGLIILER